MTVIQAGIPGKGSEKKENLSKKVTVMIGLKQEDNEDGITMEVLLDSSVTELVISSQFARKNKFKKKLERPIYIRNIDGIFNYEEPIEHTVEVELFYREHKERIEINVIEGQKQSMILEMLWLACHNSEIDWNTGKMKMMRCINLS